MPQFAANLSWMYTEPSFTERFAAAARDGFKAVEFLSPYAWPAAELKALLEENEQPLALDYAQALSCPRIHVMAGVLPEAAQPPT